MTEGQRTTVRFSGINPMNISLGAIITAMGLTLIQEILYFI
jgi:hypothetical protein